MIGQRNKEHKSFMWQHVIVNKESSFLVQSQSPMFWCLGEGLLDVVWVQGPQKRWYYTTLLPLLRSRCYQEHQFLNRSKGTKLQPILQPTNEHNQAKLKTQLQGIKNNDLPAPSSSLNTKHILSMSKTYRNPIHRFPQHSVKIRQHISLLDFTSI